MDMIIKTTNLCKTFGKQKAVNSVSMNIQRNSIYGLLGPNGAGKSTTLKMISGILKPTAGTIEFGYTNFFSCATVGNTLANVAAYFI